MVDSHFVPEIDNKFSAFDIIGGRGFTLQQAIDEIDLHYNKKKNDYDAILYKVTAGINDITCKMPGCKNISLNYESPITDHVDRLLALPLSHTKMFISLCQIPGAHLRSYNDLQGIPCIINPDEQSRLEGLVDLVNADILAKSDQRWVDVQQNAIYADRINCNKSWRKLHLPAYIIRRMSKKGIPHPKFLEYRRNYNRLEDGLHFTEKHRSWSADLLLDSMKLERANVRALVAELQVHLYEDARPRRCGYKRKYEDHVSDAPPAPFKLKKD